MTEWNRCLADWLTLHGGQVNRRPTEVGWDSEFRKMGVLERPAILAGLGSKLSGKSHP